MKPQTRAIIALCFALFSIIMLLNKCQQQRVKQYQFEHSWTPELEQQMREVFYTQISNLNVSDSVKTAYVDCCFSNIKELFPDGLSGMEGSKMTDSTKIAVMNACAKCATMLTASVNVWQPEFVQQLKLQFYSYPEVKLLPQAAKSEYVDCLAFKLKNHFPEGLNKAGKDSVKRVIENLRKGCLILIVNKYKKQKLKDTLSK